MSNSHLRELRPVLPKPPSSHLEHQRLAHTASSPPLSPPRRHSHSEVLYSPYGRAYKASYAFEPATEFNPMGFPDLETNISMNNVIVTSPDGQSIPWNAFNTEPTTSQALCGCGPSCSCPGCFEHRGSAAAVQALLGMSNSGCTDPTTCTSCVECSVILPPPQPMQTEMQDVEEWLRQLTASSPLPSDGSSQSLVYAGQDQMQPTASTSGYNDSPINVGDWMFNEFDTQNPTANCNCPPRDVLLRIRKLWLQSLQARWPALGRAELTQYRTLGRTHVLPRCACSTICRQPKAVLGRTRVVHSPFVGSIALESPIQGFLRQRQRRRKVGRLTC
jgi:hypothetical protein